MLSTNESSVEPRPFPDRWSKDLIGTEAIPTTSGFNLGRACYTATEFGTPQVHADQEAVFVISGVGEIKVGGEVIPLEPGVAVYVGRGVEHCARRTTDEPVQVVYCHGAV
ncbi:cupin domain-containing protein [bacterium]|nr:cupin domain-containing protein [bacterium]